MQIAMNNAKKLGLRNSYIAVKAGGSHSFGGSQMWFGVRKEERKALDKFKKENIIRAFGCGLIAGCDIFDYLCRKEGVAFNGCGAEYTEEEYEKHIFEMNKKYFHTRYYFGVTGFKLARKMNRLFKSAGLSYKASWGVGADVLPKRIEEMLDNDTPVLISVGPAILKKKELTFYEIDDRKDGRLFFNPSTHTKDHYVTITGLYEDGDKTMLEISSWGKRYFIDYSEYAAYVSENDNTLFSNILYITKEK